MPKFRKKAVEVEAVQHTASELLAKIAEVSDAVGFGAGEPATEIAGFIVSVLHANPERVGDFMDKGSELLGDFYVNFSSGSLSYRDMQGHIAYPSDVREKLGQVQ